MRNRQENGIQQIRVRNFKVFREEAMFEINGRHVLVYGANGSGKSSLYWALYTLLQAVTKQQGETDKYFVYEGDESLLNIHEAAGIDSFIALNATVASNPHQARLDETGLSVDGVMQGAAQLSNWFADLEQCTEFMNHRQLAAFYGFANSEEIDLIPAFEGGFYPFLKLQNGNTFLQEMREMEAEIAAMSLRARRVKDAFINGRLQRFNDAWGTLVVQLRKTINRFLRKNFSAKSFRVHINPASSYRLEKLGRRWVITRPTLKLYIEEKRSDGAWHHVDRPQSFLNEAMLTRMGLAIRFSLMLRRPQGLPLNVLLLDDVLISMDMENRARMIKMLQRRYYHNHQLFIFTHDKPLYNYIRREIDDHFDDWAVYEVAKNDGNECVVTEGRQEIKKAAAYLKDGNLEACALELRKLAELSLRAYINKVQPGKLFPDRYVSLFRLINLAYQTIHSRSLGAVDAKIAVLGLSSQEISWIKSEEKSELIIRFASASKKKKEKIIGVHLQYKQIITTINPNIEGAIIALKSVDKIRERILNHGAHITDDPLFKNEMEDAVQIMEIFKQTLMAAA